MLLRCLAPWLIPTLVLGYSPSASELLLRMESALRSSIPVKARVVRQAPESSGGQEVEITVPAQAAPEQEAGSPLALPFDKLTSPRDSLFALFPSLVAEGASVSLERSGKTVCYVLAGTTERLWLRKTDLIPVKAQLRSREGLWTTYLYLEPASISDDAVYPSRTEVWQNDALLFVERLIPAAAATVEP